MLHWIFNKFSINYFRIIRIIFNYNIFFDHSFSRIFFPLFIFLYYITFLLFVEFSSFLNLLTFTPCDSWIPFGPISLCTFHKSQIYHVYKVQYISSIKLLSYTPSHYTHITEKNNG